MAERWLHADKTSTMRQCLLNVRQARHLGCRQAPRGGVLCAEEVAVEDVVQAEAGVRTVTGSLVTNGRCPSRTRSRSRGHSNVTYDGLGGQHRVEHDGNGR